MCVVPFLQPRHFPPIRSFYDEWLAFAFGSAALFFAAIPRRSGQSLVHSLPACLAVFALLLFGRGLFDTNIYPQISFLWGMYVLFAALIFLLGHDLAEEFGRESVCDFVAKVLLAGAVANSAAGVLQLTRIPEPLEAFVAHLSGARAVGNIGQSNLYANYLALGEASLIYLVVRFKVSPPIAVACGVLLAGAAALSASRTYLLYAPSFAILGYLAARNNGNREMRHLAKFSAVLTVISLCLQWLVPAGMNFFDFRSANGFQRLPGQDWDPEVFDSSLHLRWTAWQLAAQLFLERAATGFGPGGFAEAAFLQGLPRDMAEAGVWSSPHNIILHLLSETGLLGAGLICLGGLAWIRSSTKEFSVHSNSAQWWVLSCACVELLHSLLEYPLWYAHFLALTAFVLGLGCAPGNALKLRNSAKRSLYGVSSIGGAILLSLIVTDYFRFDIASPVAGGHSLASNVEIQQQRDALADLGRGILAPQAELWLFLSYPVDDRNLYEKIEVGKRVMTFHPSREVVVRQSIFLALSDHHEEAMSLLRRALRTFDRQARQIRDAVNAAPPEARKILAPVL